MYSTALLLAQPAESAKLNPIQVFSINPDYAYSLFLGKKHIYEDFAKIFSKKRSEFNIGMWAILRVTENKLDQRYYESMNIENDKLSANLYQCRNVLLENIDNTDEYKAYSIRNIVKSPNVENENYVHFKFEFDEEIEFTKKYNSELLKKEIEASKTTVSSEPIIIPGNCFKEILKENSPYKTNESKDSINSSL